MQEMPEHLRENCINFLLFPLLFALIWTSLDYMLYSNKFVLGKTLGVSFTPLSLSNPWSRHLGNFQQVSRHLGYNFYNVLRHLGVQIW